MRLDSLLKQKGEYHPMREINCSFSSLVKTGEHVAKDVKMSPDSDLRDIVKRNGGTIHDITFSLFDRYYAFGVLDNSIYVHKKGSFDILLHGHLRYDRERYVIARELGHYVLHAKDDMCFAAYDSDDQLRREAHCFTLGFLLPEYLFCKQCQETSATDRLSFLFCVPPEFIESRKYSLGLK
jgi:Zn-dependent peptidase ImmA (M78 family)